ncbi:RtcB family protein [Magnetococcales bacterium HHB-1]
MNKSSYEVITSNRTKPIKMWTKGVPVEDGAKKQLKQTASLPFIFKWVAAMPDVHQGMGSTIGSVIPTKDAIMPASVGVDIGCGMMAVKTSLKKPDLPQSLAELRSAIEKAVPHGRSKSFRQRDHGSWGEPPEKVLKAWKEELEQDFNKLIKKHPKLKKTNNLNHLGTLGTGNHFIEICLDENDQVWVMLHSGSRGVGNAIGRLFIDKAKQEMKRYHITLPHQDLAYLSKGTDLFNSYMFAVNWAQRFAKTNRRLMMEATLETMERVLDTPFKTIEQPIDCHHNYVARERHYGESVLVTRKGAVRAQEGEMGIIPGSMGARSHIVRGLGNPESFTSCSHGAGRTMSRTEARKRISLEEHRRATASVECRKDRNVLDESPAAYKSIDAVMEAQKDLVEIVHTLKQVVCVKG